MSLEQERPHPVHGQTRPDVFDILRVADVDLVGTDLDAPDPDERARLRALLTTAERQVADRFFSERHRAHYVVARGRLRELLGQRLGVAPAAVELITTKYGKPSLGARQAAPDLAFNLSHSGSLAVYAFTARHTVGVDIEHVREIPDAEGLATRFFSPSEAEAFRAVAASSRRDLTFLACWTRKEAFVKAIGEGLSHPLDAFDVTIDPDAPARITRVGVKTAGPLGWGMASFQPRDGYIGAVVYPDGD